MGHSRQDFRPSKDLRISPVPPVLPGRPSLDQLPESIRCALPPNVAVALDSRARRNILRALHGGGAPIKLTVGELEADQRIEASASDVRAQTVVLAKQEVVTVEGADDIDAEPRYASAVATDRLVVATLTVLETWDRGRAGTSPQPQVAGY